MSLPTDRAASLRLPPAAPRWRQTLWTILGALMFGGFLVAGLVWTVPVLVSDWRIHAAARPVANAEVTDGHCSAKLIFNICDATIRVTSPHGPVTRSVNYVFTGLHLGDYGVRTLADPAHPELVSTDLGLDRLWNRTITFALGAALLLALTVLPLWALVRNRRRAA